MKTLCCAQLLWTRDTFSNYWCYYHRIFPCLRGMPLHVHLCQLHIYQWVFFVCLQWNVVYSLCLAVGSGLYSICPTHRLHDRIQGFLGWCSVLIWVVHLLSLFLPWSAIWSPKSPTVYQQRKCVAHHKTTRQRGTYSWLATTWHGGHVG